MGILAHSGIDAGKYYQLKHHYLKRIYHFYIIT
jgi:hypothetical protein